MAKVLRSDKRAIFTAAAKAQAAADLMHARQPAAAEKAGARQGRRGLPQLPPDSWKAERSHFGRGVTRSSNKNS